MDTCNSDIALFVIQYCNVIDSCRLAQTSKRFYYLVHEYRRLRGPQLVAAASDNGNNHNSSNNNSNTSSNNNSSSSRSRSRLRLAGFGPPEKTAKQLYQCALQKLQTKPNLVLAFNTIRSTLPEKLPSLVPRDAIILGAVSPAIQSNIVDNDNGDNTMNVDCISKASIMLGSMPNAQIRPFSLATTAGPHDTTRDILHQLRLEEEEQQQRPQQQPDSSSSLSSSSSWWKVFIVYATQHASNEMVENFLNALQKQYPRAVIVGGICSMAYVSVPTAGITRETLQGLSSHELVHWSRCLGGGGGDTASRTRRTSTSTRGMTKRELIHHVYSLVQTRPYRLLLPVTQDFDNNGIGCGIVGIALGGHQVPVRSVVSRGVVSLTTGTTQPSNCLFVHQASFHQPGDHDYMFQQQQQQQTRRRRRRRNNNDVDNEEESENDDEDDNDGNNDNNRLPSYYLIRSIRDESTGKTWTPNELCRSKGRPDYLGISSLAGGAQSDDGGSVVGGFELHTPHPLSYNLNAFLLFIKNQEQQHQQPQPQQQTSSSLPTFDSAAAATATTCALTNAAVDLFDLNGDACIDDLEWTLTELATTCRLHQEEILGAVMYSCSGRGPTASALMRGETMADATRFARVFNHHHQHHDAASTDNQTCAVSNKARNVPCLGFYAGGEIGPLALAGRRGRPTTRSQDNNTATTAAAATTTHMIFQRGGVALQGFTVVFALFVVPVFDLSASPGVDDSRDNVHAYFAQGHSQQQQQQPR